MSRTRGTAIIAACPETSNRCESTQSKISVGNHRSRLMDLIFTFERQLSSVKCAAAK